MLSSLILSLAMTTSPAIIEDKVTLDVKKSTTDRREIRVTTDRREIRVTTDRREIRVTTDRREIRVTTDRREIRV